MIKLDNNSLIDQETAKQFSRTVVHNYDNSAVSPNYSKLATAIEKTAFEKLSKAPRTQADWFVADVANLLNLIGKRNRFLKAHVIRSI